VLDTQAHILDAWVRHSWLQRRDWVAVSAPCVAT
jgi:hypothetical protein